MDSVVPAAERENVAPLTDVMRDAAASRWSFDHPFKVSLIPPAEKGGKYRVKVNGGVAYHFPLYSRMGYFSPAFNAAGQGYIGGDMAELPDNAFALNIVAGAIKSGIAFDTYEQDVGDEEDVVFRGKVNGWTFKAAALFFDADRAAIASILGCEQLMTFRVAHFSRTKNADGAETVSVTQTLFSDIFLPYWTPDFGHNQQGWL